MNSGTVQQEVAVPAGPAEAGRREEPAKRLRMKDITLNNGRVMSDAEFVKELGCGDTLTDWRNESRSRIAGE